MSELHDELRKIYDKHGYLDPDLVVTYAKDPKNPLHAWSGFTWDVQEAAEWAWREQARHLIKSFKVVYRDPENGEKVGDVRAWYAIRREEKYVWEPLEKVATDPVLNEIVIRQMEREIAALRQRYGHYQAYRELLERELETLAA